MTNRRKFLKLLGVGSASAPMAVKRIIDPLSLTGIKVGPFSSDRGIADAAADARYVDPSEVTNTSRAMQYLHKFGKLPDHVERRIRDSSRHVRYLDHDIAIKCWSMSVKVLTQRERNYEAAVTRYREGMSYEDAQKAFAAAAGFQWPW